MKNHKHILSFMLIMIMISVSACGGAGGGTPESADPGTPDSAAATETEEVSEESTDTLVTEDDYRNAIASAADDEKRLELYKQFSSFYRMSANEYIAYAGLCEAAGDTVSQRNALWRLYMIDPTEENGQRMSDVVVNITDAEDANVADMIKNVVEEVKKCDADDFSSDGLRTVFTSEEWKNSFWLDNGTFTSHTKYLGDKVSATVDADSIETRVTVTADDDRYFARMSYDGLSAGHVSKGDASGDKYYLRQKDAGGVDTVIVNGYTDNGHYVNQLEINVGTVVYTGTLDNGGKTKEEQPAGLNGVAYAYTSDRNNYLYVEGADASSWIADIKEMGFEDF